MRRRGRMNFEDAVAARLSRLIEPATGTCGSHSAHPVVPGWHFSSAGRAAHDALPALSSG